MVSRGYMRLYKVMDNPRSSNRTLHLSPTTWARTRFDSISPGSAAPAPGAITLSASFAGWLDAFFHRSICYG